VIPSARKVVAARAALDTVVKTIYPNLLDPKHADAVTMEYVMNVVPALRVLPNAKILIGDMIAGEKLRAKGQKPSTPAPKPTPKAPKVPGTPSSSSAAPVDTKPPAKSKDWDIKKFAESGGSRDALVSMTEGLLGDV